ncbi:MAG: hypothetical protein MI919_24870, partial [Holophagales bacterium]|nr:hypothetical protein [Holophagales bacterium]
PSLGLVYLGWDRSDSDPLEAVTIHHPGTSRKRISVARGPLYSTSHLDRRQRPGANHLFVPSWQRGTTEGGSSGAPLLGPDGRVVGTLHGGYAACGNREGDWFGRLSAAWWGPGPSLRLRDWLDPEDSQAIVLDPLVP